jgi:two-component system LytT family response regulator
MLSALLVDDEAQGRSALRGKLELFCPEVKPIWEASSVDEAYPLLVGQRPNLLFLDIHLGDKLGFELLERLAADEAHWNGEVIFVTAHDEFAVRAIRFSALDYLLKPIDPEELVSAVRRAEQRRGFAPGLPVLMDHVRGNSEAGKKIVVPCQDGMHILRVAEIVRCESTSNYTQFFMKSGKKLLASKTLKEYDLLLADYGFERIHKSHLVNMEFVKRYVPSDGGYVILEDDSTIPVANRKKDVLVARLRSL